MTQARTLKHTHTHTHTHTHYGSEILQIAGRAGRFGTESAEGEVTTLYPEDMSAIRDGLKAHLTALRRACIRPELHMLEVFARGLTERWRRKVSAPCSLGGPVLYVAQSLSYVDIKGTVQSISP